MHEMVKIMISKEGHAWQKKKISALPQRLVGSQALAQDNKSVLAHWRYDYEALATRKRKKGWAIDVGTKGQV
jgi:hypothetical protein